MAIAAPISKFKRNNLKIYIGACIVFTVVLAYDGYLSKYSWSHRQSFYNKHVKEGKLDETMMFHRVGPLFLIALGAGLYCYLGAVKNKKITADESKLTIDSKTKIPYDSIGKIDKTYFEKKGFFHITYRDENNTEKQLKLSNRRYDNLQPVLEKVIEEIS